MGGSSTWLGKIAVESFKKRGRRGHSKTVGEIMQCVYVEKKKFLGIVEHPIVPCCKEMRDINEYTSYREINILNISGKM